MAPRFPSYLALVALGGLVVVVWTVANATPGVAGTPAGAHAFFAAGALPLILGAIAYFVPTLTRTGPPERWVAAAPLAALAAAALVVGSLVRGRPLAAAVMGAPLGLLAVLGLLGWSEWRARRTLGAVHPGLRWYQGSLVCFGLGLLAIGVAAQVTALWAPLRAAHVRLNLFGGVGLAALGTLPVLLPTVGGYADRDAAARLQRDLPLVLAGVAALALAAALGATAFTPNERSFATVLALAGATVWFVPMAGLWRATWPHRRALAAAPGGGALLVALAGAAAALAAAAGSLTSGTERALVPLFAAAFVLPLATGALTHLLPVWRWPGAQGERRAEGRRLLGWGTWPRAALFAAAGVLGAVGRPEGAWLAAAGAAWFALAAAVALRPRRAARASEPTVPQDGPPAA